MNDLKWFFPESSSDCLILMNKGFRPHGGGTFLIKTSLSVPGLFDLSRVAELHKAELKNDSFEIGAGLTYFDAASFAEQKVPGNLLSKALFSAASTPLRNRISVGGSIYALPKWSDIAAPVAASGGTILFADSVDQSLPEFLKDSKNKKLKLISAIRIPTGNLFGGYYRFGLTGFDYPFFTIAVSRRKNGVFSAAVSGSRNRIDIFSGSPSSIAEDAGKELSFADQRGLSGQYLKTRALVELSRLLDITENNDE